jgi:TolA-binding protein
MTSGNDKGPRWSGAIPALACGLALAAAGCLTPSQSRSVGDQLGEIRRQAERVHTDQRRIGESIATLAPEGRTGGSHAATAAETSIEPPPVVEAGASPLERGAGGEVERRMAEGNPPSGGDSLFREGYALYHRRDYLAAEDRLRLYLAGDPDGPMADDARYWIGECRFARGLYRDAMSEYRALINRFPGGSRAPQARYRMALCHERLGDLAAMREQLAIIVDDHPESEVAPLARARLETL